MLLYLLSLCHFNFCHCATLPTVTVPVYPPRISHGLSCDCPPSSAVRGQPWQGPVCNKFTVYSPVVTTHTTRCTENKTGNVRITYLETRLDHCCCGKAISITYSDCVSVALGIHHAICMRRIILLPCPVWPYYSFPHYLIKGTI